MDQSLRKTFDNIDKIVGKNPQFYSHMGYIMKNSYWGKIGDEMKLQILVATYITITYKNALFMHPVNEGRRSPWEQYTAKYSGMRAGMPDIMIFNQSTIPYVQNPGATYRGLAIELKIGKNKPTKSQEECMTELTACGWRTNICYTFEEAKIHIDQYMQMA